MGHLLAGNHAQIAAVKHDIKAYAVSALPATNIIEQLTLEKLQKLGSFTKEQAFNALQDTTQMANKNIVNILTDDDLLIGVAKLLTNGNLGQNVIIEGVGHSIEATNKAIDINKDYSIEVQDLSLIEKAVKKLNDFLADVFDLKTNDYKDKQYTDFADALKYFNEDGTINFAQFLADTKNIRLYDPIAIDLNGNGKIDTLTLENGVFFDHNGDKVAFKSSWIDGKDGLLARDIDNDGKITSGAELFGNFTRLENGELARSGAEALKDLDDNNDGVLDEKDTAFNKILVWQDINSDGISDSDELKSLSDYGIKSINLKFLDDNKALDKDNKQILVSSFKISSSVDESLMSDIDFSVNTIERNMLDSKDIGIMKGTGFVKDFDPTLSTELQNAYEEYKNLSTKEEQLQAISNIVNLWAKTSSQYNELNEPMQKININVASVASGTLSSGINEMINRANAGQISISQSVLNENGSINTNTSTPANTTNYTPSGARTLYDFNISDKDKAEFSELSTKLAVISVFSGKESGHYT